MITNQKVLKGLEQFLRCVQSVRALVVPLLSVFCLHCETCDSQLVALFIGISAKLRGSAVQSPLGGGALFVEHSSSSYDEAFALYYVDNFRLTFYEIVIFKLNMWFCYFRCLYEFRIPNFSAGCLSISALGFSTIFWSFSVRGLAASQTSRISRDRSH